MTIVTWSTDRIYEPREFEMTQEQGMYESLSPYNKYRQSSYIPGTASWSVNMTFPGAGPGLFAHRARLEAYCNRFRDRQDQVRIWHFKRPVPYGTMRGSPAVDGVHAQFAKTLNIRGAAAGVTLIAGDLLGVNGLLVEVAADCVTDAFGAVAVSLTADMRTALTDGMAITWDKPTALFIRVSPRVAPRFSPGEVSGFSIDFAEYF